MEPNLPHFNFPRRFLSSSLTSEKSGYLRKSKGAFFNACMQSFYKVLALLSGFILLGNGVLFSQTVFTGSSTGNWTTLSWVKTGSPTTATYPGQPGHESEIHDVVITGVGVTVTLNGNISSSIRNVDITSGSFALTSSSLTMKGDLTGNGAISFTTGSLIIAGNNLSTGTFSSNNGTMHYNGASQVIRGNILYYNLMVSGTDIKTLSSSINVSHDFTLSSCTVQASGRSFSVTGTTTISGGGIFTTDSNLGTKSFKNLILSGGSITNTSGSAVVMNISGDIMVNNNAVSTLSNITSTVTGNTTVNAGAGLTFGGNNGSKIFSGIVTINGSWNNAVNEAVTFGNDLIFNGISFISGSSQYRFNSNFQNISGTSPITFVGNILINSPTIVNNRSTVTLKGGLTGSGTWRNDNASVLMYESTSAPAITNFVVNTNSNQVIYGLAGDQTIKSSTYYNLLTAGTGNKTLQGNVIVNGNLQIGSGTSLDASASDYGINLKGSWQNNGIFTKRQGKVSFTGSGPQSLINSVSLFEGFYDLELNTTGPVTSNVDLTADNTLTMTNGAIIMPGKKLTLGISSVNPGILAYSAGWITGTFSRWVVTSDNNSNLIFPVGSVNNSRGMTLNFQTIANPGLLDATFVPSAPSTAGMPLFEDIYYLDQLFPEGYWSISRDGLFAFSGTYNLRLAPSGFTSFPLDAITRIVSRITGNNWYLNGSHSAGSGSYLERTGLTAFTNDYAVAPATVCSSVFVGCPANITVNAVPGSCSNVVTWTPPTMSVSCPSYSITSNYNPGDLFNVGTTQVVYILKNGAFEVDFCTFNVTVTDSETPVIVCAGNQVRTADAGSCFYTVTGTEMDPTFTFNNCPFVLTNDLNAQASLDGAQIPAGTTTVLWTISGLSGNTNSCTMEILINDNLPPSIGAIPDRIENAGPNCSFTIPDYTSITTISDNCGTPSISQTPAPGTIITGVGTSHNISISATDVFNNVSTISFTITLADNTPPVAICRNISRALDGSGNITVTSADINNGSTDNCGIASIMLSKSAFTCADLGSNNITMTVTDASGNAASCTAIVTIVDDIAPSLTCPADLTRNTDPGTCSASVAVPAPVTADNCAVTTLTWTMTGATAGVSPVAGINLIGTRNFNKGITNITYTIRDASGNQSTCSFSVTVTDNQNPLIACPANISRNSDPGICTAGVTVPDVVISDNCAATTLRWTMTGSTVASSPATGINQVGTRDFNAGTTTVAFIVLDDAGNQSTCSFTVTVSDNINPVLVCPSAITASCDLFEVPSYDFAGFLAAGGSASDNCAIDPSSFILYSFGNNGLHCPETVVRTYRISDLNGNQGTCTQTVLIHDLTPPVITGSLSAISTEGCSAADKPAPAPNISALEAMGLSVTDACSIDANLIVSSADVVTGTCPITISRTYTITDGCGNNSTALQTITIDDNAPPVITGAITATNLEGCSAADVPVAVTSISALEAMGLIISDACTANVSLLVSSSDMVTGTCPYLITRTYTITDGCGNSATAVHSITIADNTDPVITGSLALLNTEGCSASDAPAPAITVAELEVTGLAISDACTADADLSVSSSDMASGTCPLIVTRTYVVSDACGNSATILQTINVSDTTVPSTAGCPSDITMNTDPGECNAVVSWSYPLLTDNCGLLNIVSSLPSGSTFPAGTTPVTLTLTDNCGNISTCSFNVTVNDSELPVINCPAPVNQMTDHLVSTASVTVPDAVYSDNCTVAKLTWEMTGATTASSPASGINQIGTFTFNEGITNITMTITDGSDNVATCTFIVTVVAPEALQGTVTDQDNVSCRGGANGSVTIAGSGGFGSYEYKLGAGSYQPSGTFGNLAAGPYTVTVRDGLLSVIDVPVLITEPSEDLTLTTTTSNVLCFGGNTGGATAAASGGTAPYDFLWNTVPAQTTAAASGLTAGAYTVTVTDDNGCTASGNVTVNQPTASVTVTTSGINNLCFGGTLGIASALPTGGNPPYSYSWSTSPEQTTQNASGLASGSYTVTVTDDNGCEAAGTVSITEPDLLELLAEVSDAGCPDSEDGSIDLDISGGTGPYDVIWSDGITSVSRSNLLPGPYSVVVTDAHDCAATTSVIVGAAGSFGCLVIPTIITPNSDNYNDEWIITNIDLYPDAEVNIYTRWGKLIYRTKNISANPWDGRYNGKLMPTDSYHYILYLNDGSGPKSGVISVIR